MLVSDILQAVKDIPGSNAKKQILQEHSDNRLLQRVLRYANDPYIVFNIVKVPKLDENLRAPGYEEIDRWNLFLDCAKLCSERYHTGNAAIAIMIPFVSTPPRPDRGSWSAARKRRRSGD